MHCTSVDDSIDAPLGENVVSKELSCHLGWEILNVDAIIPRDGLHDRSSELVDEADSSPNMRVPFRERARIYGKCAEI